MCDVDKENYKVDDNFYKDDINLARKLCSIKQSAKSREIEFDMSFAHLKRIMSRKTCYYTGKRLKEGGPCARSVERVDNTKGYTDDNTVIVCDYINKAKGSMSIEDILSMAKAIKKHQNKVLK